MFPAGNGVGMLHEGMLEGAEMRGQEQEKGKEEGWRGTGSYRKNTLTRLP